MVCEFNQLIISLYSIIEEKYSEYLVINFFEKKSSVIQLLQITQKRTLL